MKVRLELYAKSFDKITVFKFLRYNNPIVHFFSIPYRIQGQSFLGIWYSQECSYICTSIFTRMNNRKKTVYITRKVHFNAAHKLYNPTWTEEENEAFFGKCANKYFHGHNFDMYVTIKGVADTNTGMVMDLKKLKKVIETYVVDKLDHKNINEDVDFMQGKMASIENLVVEIWDQLEPHIEHGMLHCIKLYETERQFVEYYGE